MLEIENISKSYLGIKAIKSVSFTVNENEYVTLLGPSGSGKSVLLKLLAGLESPDEGRVILNNTEITKLPCHRRGVGFVQQKYALFPHLDVFDNVAFGLRFRERDPISDQALIKRKVMEILDLVGLSDQTYKMTGQISGGQKQRVSLARTLITQPKICLLDEPLGALDANLRERMTIELQNIREELGISFVHVTGNEFEALAMGQKMLVLSDGELVQSGQPEEIYERPRTLDAAVNLNSFNVFSGEEEIKIAVLGLVNVDSRVSKAKHFVVRMDKIEIINPFPKETKKGISAQYVAKEFMGNKIIYFFRLENNKICEVEQHLSVSKAKAFKEEHVYGLSWSAENILMYDEKRRLIA